MEHIAIDLGGKESQICVRRSDGEILLERKHLTRHLGRLLRARPTSRVVLETSAEAFRIADQALACGHQVRVVAATLVRSLGVGARGIKTDQRDARVLSEVSTRIDLPSVHVPSSASRELKSICGTREVLVGARTKLINNVRGWMRTQLWRVRTGASTTFPAGASARGSGRGGASGTHHPRTRHPRHAQRTAARGRPPASEGRWRERGVSAPHDRPGDRAGDGGEVRRCLDDVRRFSSAHSVQSYLGLTPGEHASSTYQRRTGITKAGPSAVRWTLVQAAWAAIRRRPADAMVVWATEVAKRRGWKVAVVALARKMAGILYAIWRDGTAYEASRGARQS